MLVVLTPEGINRRASLERFWEASSFWMGLNLVMFTVSHETPAEKQAAQGPTCQVTFRLPFERRLLCSLFLNSPPSLFSRQTSSLQSAAQSTIHLRPIILLRHAHEPVHKLRNCAIYKVHQHLPLQPLTKVREAKPTPSAGERVLCELGGHISEILFLQTRDESIERARAGISDPKRAVETAEDLDCEWHGNMSKEKEGNFELHYGTSLLMLLAFIYQKREFGEFNHRLAKMTVEERVEELERLKYSPLVVSILKDDPFGLHIIKNPPEFMKRKSKAELKSEGEPKSSSF